MTNFVNAVSFLRNREKAVAYVATRVEDAQKLTADIAAGKAKYATLTEKNGRKQVNGMPVKDSICAVAFLLARFW
jgi:hypothetical protein